MKATASRSSVPASASMPFCAFGGSGVLPTGANPNDFYRAIAVVIVRSPTPATGVAVRAVDVQVDAGTQATLERIESVERLDPKAAVTPPGVWASRGAPFDGALAAGDTILRIEAWLTTRPSTPSTLHVELAGSGLTVSAACALVMEWPTG